MLATLEDPFALSGMAALNADLVQPFGVFLRDVIADAGRHALFLNTLSFMEHIGTRKIMMTHPGGVLDREVLQHLAEESRHALFFKKQAERFCGRPLEYAAESMLARGAAAMYFGRLDAGITRDIGAEPDRELPYLWVSLVIELRANWAYHLYQEALVATGAPFSLKSVIAEEAMHLADMHGAITRNDPLAGERLGRLAALETSLFRRFLPQLTQKAA